VSKKAERSDGNACFVCGPENPDGLQIQFRMEDGLCRAEFTPPERYAGYAGVTHGGIIFALLDDVMANWLYLQGERAYTGRSDIRFREPAPTGATLLLEGELIKRKGRLANLKGRVMAAETQLVVAEATATFIVIEDET
jgi:uncharacterized protein (TIGR00369 family)